MSIYLRVPMAGRRRRLVSGDEDDESRHPGHGRMADYNVHGFRVDDGHRTDILMR
jgi:hypothetical protein